MKQLIDRLTPLFPWLGLLSLVAGAVIYFVTRRWDLLPNITLALGALFFLLFALLRPDAVRAMLSGRRTQYGTSTVLSILFFAAIFGLLYYIAFQNPDWRIDATETDEFTPLPETVDILENLDEPIHVIGFFTIQSAFEQENARNLLDGMKAYTDKISYEFVDPDENPLLAQQYELTFNNTLVFTRGEGENEVFSKAAAPLDDRTMHTALLKVINPVDKNIYFITGNGERDIEDFGAEGMATAVRLLEEAGFDVAPLNLFVEGAIPDDATVIAIVDQQSAFTPAEMTAIEEYLANGGAAFIARDALDTEFRARLEEGGDLLLPYLASDWGISLRPDFIIEQVFAQAGQSFGLLFLGANYGASTITGNDLDRYGTIFSVVRSIAADPAVDNVTRINLVTTSDQAWGETDLAALASGVAEPNDGVDEMGPLAIGVSAENVDTNGRLVVFGDTDFVANELILQNGNSLLLSNAMNWLADDEVAVDLTPREQIDRQLTVTQSQLGLLQLSTLCLAPGLAAVIGALIWFSRRQRR